MKPVQVMFAEKKLAKLFEKLKNGKQEDKILYNNIEKAIQHLKNKHEGIKIQKQLWPKLYIKEYYITNLYKYDLANGWRLIYTIQEDDILILNVILEWFDHKEYERKFKY